MHKSFLPEQLEEEHSGNEPTKDQIPLDQIPRSNLLGVSPTCYGEVRDKLTTSYKLVVNRLVSHVTGKLRENCSSGVWL